jgi:hypothetical protein
MTRKLIHMNHLSMYLQEIRKGSQWPEPTVIPETATEEAVLLIGGINNYPYTQPKVQSAHVIHGLAICGFDYSHLI